MKPIAVLQIPRPVLISQKKMRFQIVQLVQGHDLTYVQIVTKVSIHLQIYGHTNVFILGLNTLAAYVGKS